MVGYETFTATDFFDRKRFDDLEEAFKRMAANGLNHAVFETDVHSGFLLDDSGYPCRITDVTATKLTRKHQLTIIRAG